MAKAQRKSVDDDTTTDRAADEAVTAYLASLGEPKQRGAKAKPKPDYATALAGITDKMELLRAAKAERERVDALAKAADPVDGFKRYAKQWAAANGYTKEDFRAAGVPSAVLSQVWPTTAKPKSTGSGGGERIGDSLAAHVANADKGAVFTVAGLRTEVGGTDQTIAKVLKAAVEAGTLKGEPDASYTGKGRKPNVYTKL